MTERNPKIPDRPWSVMVKDRGMGHYGPYAIADASGNIILKDIKFVDLAQYIVDLANSFPEDSFIAITNRTDTEGH